MKNFMKILVSFALILGSFVFGILLFGKITSNKFVLIFARTIAFCIIFVVIIVLPCWCFNKFFGTYVDQNIQNRQQEKQQEFQKTLIIDILKVSRTDTQKDTPKNAINPYIAPVLQIPPIYIPIVNNNPIQPKQQDKPYGYYSITNFNDIIDEIYTLFYQNSDLLNKLHLNKKVSIVTNVKSIFYHGQHNNSICLIPKSLNCSSQQITISNVDISPDQDTTCYIFGTIHSILQNSSNRLVFKYVLNNCSVHFMIDGEWKIIKVEKIEYIFLLSEKLVGYGKPLIFQIGEPLQKLIGMGWKREGIKGQSDFFTDGKTYRIKIETFKEYTYRFRIYRIDNQPLSKLELTELKQKFDRNNKCKMVVQTNNVFFEHQEVHQKATEYYRNKHKI